MELEANMKLSLKYLPLCLALTGCGGSCPSQLKQAFEFGSYSCNYADGAAAAYQQPSPVVSSSSPTPTPSPSVNPLTFIHYDDAGTGSLADPYLIYTLAQLQDLGTQTSPAALGSSFKLMASIDLLGSTVQLGSAVLPFTGQFDGQDFSILNDSILQPTQTMVGFIPNLQGRLQNLQLTGITVTGASQVGVVGLNTGEIANVTVTGSIAGSGGSVGGLVGYNQSGVSQSASSATVSGASETGGLVGFNDSVTGSITDSFATGLVAGTVQNVGGLVGVNSDGAVITRSYASGAVSCSSCNYVGGLAGNNSNSGSAPSITDSFSTGAVTGAPAAFHVDFLVGSNTGVANNNYYFAAAACSPVCAGVTGTSEAALSYFYSEAVAPFTGGWTSGPWQWTGGGLPTLE